ncbi:hypothetical protein FKW77_003873 [Venturia effusa]|uniref:Zn(2)-C6 fungal-type domain-containing protein n=1 Tax=Venturia effusa TaxID=50376 RepID=A0A517LF83_9PEZI|nr:hypothetical protein FKW77_003873 [Venturia effusa]
MLVLDSGQHNLKLEMPTSVLRAPNHGANLSDRPSSAHCKKTRCSGNCPCALCTRAGLRCEYTALYSRGRLPSVIVDNAVDVSRVRGGSTQSLPSGQATNGTAHQTVSDVDAGGGHVGEGQVAYQQDHSTSNLDAMGVISSRASPVQTDLQTHYVGPSSGVSFLQRVQKRLHQTNSFTHSSSIFAFGDAPLPDFDPAFFFLPPKSDAEELVARYFDFAVPTHRFLHRPTIEMWLDEFYKTKGVMGNERDALGRSALLLMVFAQATDYMPNSSAQDSSEIRHVKTFMPSSTQTPY